MFLINAYVFSSTKIEIRTEQVLPGSGQGWGRGNDINNVCICEEVNKNLKNRNCQICAYKLVIIFCEKMHKIKC
jgi:hypothetical protein